MMKNLTSYLKYYAFGFLIAFLFLNLTMCPETGPSTPDDEKPPVETAELKAISDNAITAFESGNPQQVLDMMYDEHKEFYEDDLVTNKERMANFANALKNRKLIAAQDLMAEYQITIDGKNFTVTFSNAGDGVWKLHRF